jgi:hypothetical protein
MTNGNSTFDRLIEQIYQQKRILEQLEEENRELRRQLMELREGRGIFIEILGLRFPLAAGPRQVATQPAPTALEERRPLQVEAGAPQASAETQLPEMTQIRASIGPAEAQRLKLQSESPTLSRSYLEELLLAEFAAAAGASAAAGPSGITGPSAAVGQSAADASSSPSAVLDEEQKAALRRELMGSFLLE